jgi:hypothetical protein
MACLTKNCLFFYPKSLPLSKIKPFNKYKIRGVDFSLSGRLKENIINISNASINLNTNTEILSKYGNVGKSFIS